MSVVLYDYWRSSAAYRVRIALNILEIRHSVVPVDLVNGEHRGRANLARNPQGLVPTLEIDGHVLTQSLAILEYLDETRNAGWLPAKPQDRAKVRALACAIAMEIHPVCNLSVARFATGNSGENLSMQDWMQQFIPRGLAAFETMLGQQATGRFCNGDGVSIADICLVPQIYNAHRWQIDLSPYPQITRITTSLESIPAIAAAHPDHHKP